MSNQLHVACGLGGVPPSVEAAKQAIVTNPAWISERTDPELYTPLYLAAANGSLEIVELLLQHGANCWDGDDRGQRLLSVATIGGFDEVVTRVLDAMEGGGCTKEELDELQGSNRIVHIAASIGHLGMLKSAIERFGIEQLEDRNEWGVTPLMAACGGESLDKNPEDQIWSDERAQTVSFLLQQGSDPLVRDSNGRTLLHTLAIFDGTGFLIEELLQRGIEIDSKTNSSDCSPGASALHIASKYCNEDTVRILLSHGIDSRILDFNQRTALHLASYVDNNIFSSKYPFPEDKARAIIKLLLDLAPDTINIRDENGDTPLLLSAKTIQSTFSILRFLHQRGADITAVNNNQENALHLIASCSHIYPVSNDIYESIRYLVRNGTDLEGKQKLSATPLLLSISRGEQRSDIVEALLKCGANVHATLKGGITALHYAYSRGFQSGVGKVLLRYGAASDAVDEQGRTPADCILMRGTVSGRGRGRGMFIAHMIAGSTTPLGLSLRPGEAIDLLETDQKVPSFGPRISLNL
ncbi:hypothetical protein VTL71DRAFT_108 [Oculimacula yallundae]|uniref:Ankyrin n=1 Tax=Oculimacula yallundae TaxID=86028 RepID=A0ABR4D1D7_9HELO